MSVCIRKFCLPLIHCQSASSKKPVDLHLRTDTSAVCTSLTQYVNVKNKSPSSATLTFSYMPQHGKQLQGPTCLVNTNRPKPNTSLRPMNMDMGWTGRRIVLRVPVYTPAIAIAIADETDAKQILTASSTGNWRRPLGRPRITWMKTIQQDLKFSNLNMDDAVDLAQNRPLWRLMSTLGAKHS